MKKKVKIIGIILFLILLLSTIGIFVYFTFLKNIEKTPNIPSIDVLNNEQKQPTSVSEDDIAEPTSIYSSEDQSQWTEEDWNRYNTSTEEVNQGLEYIYDETTGKMVLATEYNANESNDTSVYVSPNEQKEPIVTPQTPITSQGTTENLGTTPTLEDAENGSVSILPPVTPTNIECTHEHTYQQKVDTDRTVIAEAIFETSTEPDHIYQCYTQHYILYTYCSDCGILLSKVEGSEDIHEKAINARTYEGIEQPYQLTQCPCGYYYQNIDLRTNEVIEERP